MRAHRSRRRLPVSTVLVIAALTVPGIAQRADVLEPDRSVSGSLAAGGQHTYTLSVRQGDFIGIVVEQDRTDLEVRLGRDVGGSVASVQNAVQEDDVLALSAIASQQ
jgi:hypothetical protein